MKDLKKSIASALALSALAVGAAGAAAAATASASEAPDGTRIWSTTASSSTDTAAPGNREFAMPASPGAASDLAVAAPDNREF